MAKKESPQRRYIRLGDELQALVPHLAGWVEDLDEFRELRLKQKEDGSVLVVAKGYFPDGSESVCFGVGYGLPGALLGINATIAASAWKKDKPWAPS